VNEIEHREEVNPNQVDQVPVKGGEVDWTVIIAVKVTSDGSFEEPEID
jgi:hypothetical protein